MEARGKGMESGKRLPPHQPHHHHQDIAGIEFLTLNLGEVGTHKQIGWERGVGCFPQNLP